MPSSTDTYTKPLAFTPSQQLKNVFNKQISIQSSVGCEIEYNMNSLIDGITITSATPDTAYTGASSTNGNPFKKLFPVDSIIKPFRPLDPGIKYFILGGTGITDTTSQSFSNYRTLLYPGEAPGDTPQPRIYYPGVTTSYKYWLSALNSDADITLTYKPDGSTVAGNKYAISNKIIVRFEKFHSIPTACTLTVTKSDNTTLSVSPTISTDGFAVIYYDGSTWTKTAPTEPISYSTPVAIKSVRLQATNPGGGKYIGIIELSARWVKDLTADIESISITKDSSASNTDLLPVGNVTANNMSLSLTKYDPANVKMLAYNRLSSSFDTGLTYLAKNAELRPYFKIYHSDGIIGTSPNKYDKVPQGSFYINDWSTTEYGDASITALDNAKYLMETMCPDILCESYPVTAIFRRLLDSIGFTNYQFNLLDDDKSVPQINYWWTDDTKTVWESIQELCRDIQMNALFDENNVLQFYSRDYLYGQTGLQWSFYQNKEGDILPNIIDITQQEVVAANYVTVIWQTPTLSTYTGSSGPVWTSPTTFLSSGGLLKTINATDMEFIIDTQTIDPNGQQQAFYNYSGFVLIDSEIIEYEAIGYDCVFLDGTSGHKWIYSSSDVNKYLTLCKSGYADPNNPAGTAYFKPSGRYKVVPTSTDRPTGGRGSLGTVPASHIEAAQKSIGWTGREVTWA